MKITKTILNENSKNKLSLSNMLPALVASFFSVLFSLSIVFELSNIVDGIVLGFLIVFTVLFLIMNEKIKVEQIRNVYKKKYVSLIPFAVTFLISLTMSSIGIYLWTNKSFDQKIVTNEVHIEKQNDIKSKFATQIINAESVSFEETVEYKASYESLLYWKSRRAANVDERTNIREQIKTIENKIDRKREIFNLGIASKVASLDRLMKSELEQVKMKTKNDLSTIDRSSTISYIFLIMIIITELGIVILNGNISKLELVRLEFVKTKESNNYIVGRKILQSLFLTKNLNNVVNINHVKYSQPITNLDWDETKKWNAIKSIYNMFINIGVLDNKITTGKVITHDIVVTEKEAFERFDNYFEKLLSI